MAKKVNSTICVPRRREQPEVSQEGLGTQEKARFQSNLAATGREEYLGPERYTEGFARVLWDVKGLHRGSGSGDGQWGQGCASVSPAAGSKPR